MFEALINYAKSDKFCPEAEIELEALREHLMHNSTLGPVRERMMTQYWQLDEEPVESARYWKESREYCEEGDRLGQKLN